jgi:hypothetical protein
LYDKAFTSCEELVKKMGANRELFPEKACEKSKKIRGESEKNQKRKKCA